MRLAEARLTELASGVDSIYLSGRGYLPAALVSDLTRARDEAREARSGVVVDLGERFLVQPGGLHRHAFRLDHLNGVVGLTTSSSLPTVVVQLSAGFIHGVGVAEAVRWFTDLFEGLLGQVAWKASRLDLFVDTQGWQLSAEDRHHFVCRAKQRVTYEDGDTLTGFRFGSGKGGGAFARIYDKTEESRLTGSDYWSSVWGDAYAAGERVLRVEFQVGRTVLAELGIDTPEDALRLAPEAWGYLTDEWLSLRVPTQDETRSRRPLAPEWRDVQQASLRGGVVGLDRIRAGETAGALRKAYPTARGYLALVGAHTGARSLHEAFESFGRLMARDEERSGVSFEWHLAEKRRKLGLA